MCKKMKIYIAGPMTGMAGFNYPAFNEAAKEIRRLGHHVENPAENPEPTCKSWAGYMRLAIKQIIKCDAMVMLPDWSTSRGAVIERGLAENLEMDILNMADIDVLRYDVKE